MPIQNRWSATAAAEAVDRYGAAGISADLALRTYSARLLGADPELVLHGGGNTSVKTTVSDLLGDPVEVLCVKGSGWDLATIEPAGHPAVRLEPLRRLRNLAALSDEAMVSAQRQNLLDPQAPNPSVEALLHAYLPHKFVDHTHATALLALADQADAEAVCRRVFGDRVVLVPYVMPGFALAKAAAEAYELAAASAGANQASAPIGMVLLKHGLFSFGASAEESYQRMIELVALAEQALAAHPPQPQPIPLATPPLGAAQLFPWLRGLLGPQHWLLELRSSPLALAVVNDQRLADWAQRGVATPDHVIRTKAQPLVLPPAAGDLSSWVTAAGEALGRYKANYQAYFERQNARLGGGRRALDPLPRLVVIPGLGLVGLGKKAAEASIAADLGEAWARTLLAAEGYGRFEPVGENDTFDMEYWSLEQAKLGKGSAAPFAGQVVLVTGAAGAIGAATARAFARQGAALALLDRDGEAAATLAASCGPRALALACDLCDPDQVQRAFAQLAAHFGGLDVVVSNAGAAWTGPMAELPEADLRACFELNFFSHQRVAQAAMALFRAQGFGGQLLFNVSKQALNPGANFGAYGTSKAALLALMRQYALEGGAEGVRVNGLNADRIRSGLLTDSMIAERSAARGLSEAAYMGGNLLGQEVRAEDVAAAFVALAGLERSTGSLLTVDGGNVAAMVR